MTPRSTEFPGAALLAAAAAPELPQKDDLCGPFWALAAARVFGARVRDQDEAALAAGTLLWTGDSLPPGIAGRRDYRVELPATDDADRAGTDRGGVARAVVRLTGGAAAVLEITDPARRWDADGLRGLFETVSSVDRSVVVLANVATEQYLLPAEPGAGERYLATGDTAGYRSGGWRAGHFVAVLGWREGRAGRLYRVHDSYPLDPTAAAGSAEIHDQPEEAFRAALSRPGRGAGALLLVGSPATLDRLRPVPERFGWSARLLDPARDGAPPAAATSARPRRAR